MSVPFLIARRPIMLERTSAMATREDFVHSASAYGVFVARRCQSYGRAVAMPKRTGVGSWSTDHGNMFGALEFYRQGRATGIKPILG